MYKYQSRIKMHNLSSYRISINYLENKKLLIVNTSLFLTESFKYCMISKYRMIFKYRMISKYRMLSKYRIISKYYMISKYRMIYKYRMISEYCMTIQ